jgi:carbon monoxide dehydrogenase subunit G
MQLENTFVVDLALDDALQVLTDVPLIAPCLPGVEITEIVDDKNYKGEASVRLGPIKLTFQGTAEIVDIDRDKYNVEVKAKGADKKGRGGADANVTFTLAKQAEATKVDILTDLNLSGSIAQYGRAAGLIENVAAELCGQFADNLKAALDDPETGGKAKEISGLKLLIKAAVAKRKAKS